MHRNGLHYFTINDKSFVYDVNTTACAEVDKMALSVLPDMFACGRDGLAEKYGHVYPKSKLRACIGQCEELISTGMFASPPPKYRHRLQHDLLAVCLHVSHQCNMRCDYCYADAGSFGRERGLMSQDVMVKAVDFAFRHSGDHDSLEVGFFGGEPLLNFRLIQECVRYAKERAKELGKALSFSMTSNATLLDDESMELINREGFSLVFSLDGPKRIHDRMRKNWSGKGTHGEVLRNLKRYMHDYSRNFMVRGTFTRTTPNFSDQVLFLNNQGFKNVSVEPAQLHESSPHAMATQGDLERIIVEYDHLSDLYLERFDEGRPLSFFHFDGVLRSLLDPNPMHTQCGAGGGFISVTPDGKIFPCFEAVVEEKNSIGHIDRGFDDKNRRRFQRQHADAKKACRQCWLKYSCGGGCHAFNIRYNDNINVPYEPYCRFIKHRFMLSAWILSKVIERGDEAVERLRDHLELSGTDPCAHEQDTSRL